MKRTRLFTGRWLNLESVPHTGRDGTERPWEFCSRTNAARAVAVIARLKNPERIVLVRQWRAPMNAWTLEFPAGLLDEGDTPESAALRELKEETGYEAVVTRKGQEVCSSPGMTDETVGWVEVEITNHGQAAPQDDELIETVILPLENLRARIDEYCAQGDRVEGKLYGFARALEIK